MKEYRIRFYIVFCCWVGLMVPILGMAQEGQSDTRVNQAGEGEDAYAMAQYQLTIFPQYGRTLKRVFIGLGFNNAMGDGKPWGSEYKFTGSRFFEIGGELSTVLNATGFYRLNYGLSFQFNGLKPKDNRIFERNGSATNLTEFSSSLKKSKLRMDYLVIPVHFEFGPADIDYQARSWRVGVGAYSGIRLGTRQKLRYKKEGKTRSEKSAQRLNTSDFIYGLSTYVGYGKTALYLKYDLNPIFQHNPEDEHNISLGLRVTLY